MLTIQYLPYQQVASLTSQERINIILSMLKNGKVVIIDGKLSSSDEALLIRETMSLIDEEFNGMEIGVMRDNMKKNWISRVKYRMAKALIGDRSGITLIGPAKIIGELRQHPENIELHFQKEYLIKHSKPQVSDKPGSNKNSKTNKIRVRKYVS